MSLTKKEMIQLLEEKYGYNTKDLNDENGKPFTNLQLEKLIEEEEEDALEKVFDSTIVEDNAKEAISPVSELKEALIEVEKTYKELKDDDLILVMNGCSGELLHRSQRTGRMWKFTKFGQIDKIPFIELVTIYNKSPRFFELGKMIILDEQVAENFNLSEIYKNIITPKNLDGLFKKDIHELEDIIKKLPRAMKKTFIDKARELYLQGKIDSVKMIKMIEEFFGISLDDNAPISDIV